MADGQYVRYVGSWNPGLTHDECKTCKRHYHRCVCGPVSGFADYDDFCFDPEECATNKAVAEFWKELHDQGEDKLSVP